MHTASNGGRILLGWIAERKSEKGTYFKGGGFGACNLLITQGSEEKYNARGERIWSVYAISRKDIGSPGSGRGARRAAQRTNS